MYFCYLLKSKNEKTLNDTYIGFTDDPIKRLKQHNGIIKGGAKKTSKKRPWTLVLVVSNFPNKILALKFEWAWTNPFTSNFTSEGLKNFEVPANTKNKKKYYESIEFKLNVINLLISSKIYEKISLYLHIFDEEIVNNKFIGNKMNNLHIMEVTNEKNFKESIKNKIYFYENEYQNAVSVETSVENFIDKCIICNEDFNANNKKETNTNNFNNNANNINNIVSSEDEVELEAFNQNSNADNLAKCPYCKSLFHLTCLAQSTLENQNLLVTSLIPKETNCLICSITNNWSEFIKP